MTSCRLVQAKKIEQIEDKMALFKHLRPPRTANQITSDDPLLRVPDRPIVPYCPGDGPWLDFWPNCQGLIDHAVQSAYGAKRQIAWLEIFLGQRAQPLYKSDLPDETLFALRTFVVGLIAPFAISAHSDAATLDFDLARALDLFVAQRTLSTDPPKDADNAADSSALKPIKQAKLSIYHPLSEGLAAPFFWPAESAQAKEIIEFSQQNLQQRKIRFPATSSARLVFDSHEGQARFCDALQRWRLAAASQTEALPQANDPQGSSQALTQAAAEAPAIEPINWICDQPKHPMALQARKRAPDFMRVSVSQAIAQILAADPKWQHLACSPSQADMLVELFGNVRGQDGCVAMTLHNADTGHALFTVDPSPVSDNDRLRPLQRAKPLALLEAGRELLTHLGWHEAAQALQPQLDAARLSSAPDGWSSQAEALAAQLKKLHAIAPK